MEAITLSSAPGSPAACCVACAIRTCSATRSYASWRRTPSGWTGRSTRSSRGASWRLTALEPARLLVRHKRADLAAKQVEPWELEHLEELERLLEEQRESPHRLADLAVNGDDLIAIGYREGPALGAELARLLDVVVDDPAANDRATLLELAGEGLR